MKSLYHFILLFNLLALNSISYSQTDNPLNILSNYHRGFILPEYDLLQNINEGTYQGAEVSFFKTAKQKSYWQQLYNYPEYGLSLFYTKLGEDQVLGNSLGLEYFFKINLIHKDKYKLYVRSGFGFNYINRKYDAVDNPLNTSMGSNYNVRFNLRLATSVYLSKRIALNTGLGLDHFSNANTQYPNRGINAITFYGGITYSLGEKTSDSQDFELSEQDRSFESIVTLYVGFLHTKWPNNTYYPVPTMSYDLNYSVGRIFNLAIGGDVFYDSSVNERYSNTNPVSAGLHLAQSIRYNKFSFTLQEGLYLFSDKNLNKNTMYNRVVFKWQVSDKIGLNLNTLSYLNDLEFVGVGFSYQFN